MCCAPFPTLIWWSSCRDPPASSRRCRGSSAASSSLRMHQVSASSSTKRRCGGTRSCRDLPGYGVVVVPVPDHVIRVELRDLVLRVAEQAAQHVLVVIAHLQRRTDDGRNQPRVPAV